LREGSGIILAVVVLAAVAVDASFGIITRGGPPVEAISISDFSAWQANRTPS
jgi:hypothetical protein